MRWFFFSILGGSNLDTSDSNLTWSVDLSTPHTNVLAYLIVSILKIHIPKLSFCIVSTGGRASETGLRSWTCSKLFYPHNYHQTAVQPNIDVMHLDNRATRKPLNTSGRKHRAETLKNDPEMNVLTFSVRHIYPRWLLQQRSGRYRRSERGWTSRVLPTRVRPLWWARMWHGPRRERGLLPQRDPQLEKAGLRRPSHGPVLHLDRLVSRVWTRCCLHAEYPRFPRHRGEATRVGSAPCPGCSASSTAFEYWLSYVGFAHDRTG